jgi:hypothetical protein
MKKVETFENGYEKYSESQIMSRNTKNNMIPRKQNEPSQTAKS